MNVHENPNHDDLLERATEALRQTRVPPDPPSDLVVDVVAQLEREQAADTVQPQSLFARIKSMKPMTKFVVVASLFVAFGGLLSWLSPGGRALAVEDVAEALDSLQSATCDMTAETRGVKNQSKVMFLAPSLERIETRMSGAVMSINICDMRAKKWLTLIPQQKMAIAYTMENAPEDRPANGTFELIRERFRKAQGGPDKGSRKLGRKRIDGVRAVGFRLEDKTGSTEVWADPKTSLPIRVKTTFLTEPKVEVVLTNFKYDVELDEALFSFVPPKDYKAREMKLDVTPASIKDLGDMLRFGAENNDGVFPEELSGVKGVHLVMQKLLKEVQTKHGLDSTEWKDAVVKYSTKIARGNAFVMLETPKSEWHYQGAGVKLGDAKTVVFWYKPQGSDTYQVLYGDLRIEKGIAEADLPKDAVKK